MLKGLTNNFQRTDRDILSKQDREGKAERKQEGRQEKQEGMLLHADTLNAHSVKDLLQ